MSRYYVTRTFHPALGWMSEILDRQGSGRILVAGVDHAARAERRAAQLNALPAGAAEARAGDLAHERHPWDEPPSRRDALEDKYGVEP